jgi:hypothetical protein
MTQQLELNIPFKEPQVEALRQRVRDLEETLGLVNHTVGAFKLSPAGARILSLMMRLPYVTPEMLENRLALATAAKVAMHRLRKRLKPFGIVVSSKHSVGYWLEPEQKDKVREVTAEHRNRQPELPF